MSEKELIEKIEQLEKRVAELEKNVSYIQEDIYEFVEEDDDECGGHCRPFCHREAPWPSSHSG